jgi:hypothetical protein
MSSSPDNNEAFLPSVSASSRAQIMSPQATTLALRDDDGAFGPHWHFALYYTATQSSFDENMHGPQSSVFVSLCDPSAEFELAHASTKKSAGHNWRSPHLGREVEVVDAAPQVIA